MIVGCSIFYRLIFYGLNRSSIAAINSLFKYLGAAAYHHVLGLYQGIAWN
jgi:hypothetical protein